ncbi:MAG TPA: DUF115 domain-containing protein [Exilispira sp.]|nr:DUF115 domain-containing protein [Exilispira sp.]
METFRYLDENLRFIKKYIPYDIFAKLIRNKNNFYTLNIEKKANLLTAEFDKRLALSIDLDKIRDLDKISTYHSKNDLNNFSENNVAVFTSFFIFCLIHQFTSIDIKFSIIIIEDLEFVLSILNTFDISIFFKNDSSYFFIFDSYFIDKTIDFLAQNPVLLKSSPLYYSLPSYDKFMSGQYNERLNLFKSKFQSLLIDYSTSAVMLTLEIENVIKNLNFVKHTFKSRMTKVDNALVISAGPSLNKNINKIKYLEKLMPVIAVDTAAALILKSGIRVDFLVILDPQILNYYDFLGLDRLNDETFLVVSLTSNNKIVKKFYHDEIDNRLIFFCAVNPNSTSTDFLKLKDFLSNLTNFSASNMVSQVVSETLELCKLPVFGNVSLAAVSFALNIANNVIIAGFDNNFDNLVYHCNEALDIQSYRRTQNYFSTVLSNVTKYCLRLIDKSVSTIEHKRTNILLERDQQLFSRVFEGYPVKKIESLTDEDYLSFSKGESLSLKDNFISQLKKNLILNTRKSVFDEKEATQEFKKRLKIATNITLSQFPAISKEKVEKLFSLIDNL